MKKEEDPRRKMLALRLGPLGETFTEEEARTKILKKLATPACPPDLIRAVLFELLTQHPEILVDLRLLGGILEQKRKNISSEKHQKYVAWVYQDWAKICEEHKKTGKLAIRLDLGTAKPVLFNSENLQLVPTEDWIIRPVASTPGLVKGTPTSEDHALGQWKKELGADAGFDTSGWHMMSLKSFTWHLNLYSPQTLDRRYNRLRGFLEDSLKKRVAEQGWVAKKAAFYNTLIPRRGILGRKEFLTGWTVELEPKYRKKLLEKYGERD